MLTTAVALLEFDDLNVFNTILYALKYKNNLDASVYLGEWFWEVHKQHLLSQNFTSILPVPLHKKKQRKRGYNQVEPFAKVLATKT